MPQYDSNRAYHTSSYRFNRSEYTSAGSRINHEFKCFLASDDVKPKV